MADLATTPACPDLACRRVRWALHVMRTLEKDGCRARTAASLGLQDAFANGGGPGVWKACEDLVADALYGWVPEPPEPLPPVQKLERCEHGELPNLCVSCVGEKLRANRGVLPDGRLVP